MVAVGSRGDCQPLVALGSELMRRGHTVCLIGSRNARGMCEEEGIGFVPDGSCGVPPDARAASLRARLLDAAAAPTVREGIARLGGGGGGCTGFRDAVQRAVIEAEARGPFDCVIGTVLFVVLVAHALRARSPRTRTVPVWISLMPRLRTARWPHVWSAEATGDEVLRSHAFDTERWCCNYTRQRAALVELGLAGDRPPPPTTTESALRAIVEGRDPTVLALAAYSSQLFGPAGYPADLAPEARSIHMGAFTMRRRVAAAAEPCVAFAAAGECVYFGWGSMPVRRPARLLEQIALAVETLQCRAVVLVSRRYARAPGPAAHPGSAAWDGGARTRAACSFRTGGGSGGGRALLLCRVGAARRATAALPVRGCARRRRHHGSGDPQRPPRVRVACLLGSALVRRSRG